MSTNITDALGDTTRTVDFMLAIVGDGKNSWPLAMTPFGHLYKALGDVSTKKFERVFKPVAFPKSMDWRNTFGVSRRFVPHDALFFEGAKMGTHIGPHVMMPAQARLRDIMHPVQNPDFEFQLAGSLYKSKSLIVPPSLARYALLFYASNLVRYRPARLDERFGSETAWLVDSLATESSIWVCTPELRAQWIQTISWGSLCATKA